MVLAGIILTLIGAGLFYLGIIIDIELVIIFGILIGMSGLINLLAYISSYNKSDEEKYRTLDEMTDKATRDLLRTTDYRSSKLIINDKINDDIKKDVSDGNKMSRY